MSESFDFKIITQCRVCGSKELAFILSLGSIYVSDFVTDRVSAAEKTYPLELVLCDPGQGGCGLLQLRHTVNPEKMYGFYYYHSGTNAMMRKALLDITTCAEKKIDLKKGDMVLDIGCNDGTLLRSYRKRGIKLVGFDPAKNLVPEARVGTTKIINGYFDYEAFEENFAGKKASVCALVAQELASEAKEVCDAVILQEDFQRYAKDKKAVKKLVRENAYFIGQANIMPQVASAFGRVLGPKGKMPNPKAGCIVPPKASLKPLYDKLQNTIRVSAKTAPVVQCRLGNEKMSDEHITQNLKVVYDQLVHSLPNGEDNVKAAFLKLTMGRPVRVK